MLILFFPTQVIRHIFLSSVPLAAFVIFGPQRDLLACWFGWLPCYPRRPKPEWAPVPIPLPAPYTPRLHTPTLPRGFLSLSKEKSSPPSNHPDPSTVARTEISTTDNRGLRNKGHSPSSPADITTPFPVPNYSTLPVSQALIPPPPYPLPGNSEPGIGTLRTPPSAHVPEEQDAHGPHAVGAIR